MTDSSAIEWGDLRFVLAIERHGTLVAAARALGCSQSTVTRRLAALHEALGARVLERRGGEYALTGAGERLRPYLEQMEETVLAVERAALGYDAQPRGAVRVTTIETLATRFLAQRLGPLRERYPEIELEIDVDRRALDLGRREADVALRVARPRQPSLVARKVAALGIALYASRGYLAERGAPRRSAMDRHLVVADQERNAWMPEARMLAQATRGGRVVFRSSSWLAQLVAVEAGVGLGALPCFLADASPSLRRVGRADDVAERGVWLIVHRDLSRVSRVVAVTDYLAAAFKAEARALAGRRG